MSTTSALVGIAFVVACFVWVGLALLTGWALCFVLELIEERLLGIYGTYHKARRAPQPSPQNPCGW